MEEETKSIECVCHRCDYRWQYRGSSKYIACCPRCKMTVYIPKMLRLRNEAHRHMIHENLDVERQDKNSLDARPSKSITSSGLTQRECYGRH
jgi:hypothetical protein